MLIRLPPITPKTLAINVGDSARVAEIDARITRDQSWALISQTTKDSVGGLAVFRLSVAGRPDFEAVVPIVNRQFDNHFVMLFDNTVYNTRPLANPTPS
jgi:hypothetical protein